MHSLLRRILIGEPLPTRRRSAERLNLFYGLAVFASDALSSSAYATEEILLVLILAGSQGLKYSLEVALAISLLLWIVIMSYRQVVHAYPGGGGSYIVSRKNLGPFAGQVASAALFTDYILTVAVSVSSGIAAVTSALPGLAPHKVALAVGAIAFITLANLRGLRESAKLFAVFAYSFLSVMAFMLVMGLARHFLGLPLPVPVETPAALHATHSLGLFLVLKAFASGCVALTGIEATSNGVTAFKDPAPQNAAKVLSLLGLALTLLFLGITYLSRLYTITPNETQTVVSQIAHLAFGNGFFYYLLQTLTCIILVIAANTSFNGFPRLAAVVASDGYMPRQLVNLGDRLVYSNGIIALGTLASLLVIVFRAETHALIPLYAIGVFLAFTLSQIGMVLHWYREKGEKWHLRAFINGLGALATGVVLVIILIEKFTSGAWIICLLIPLLVAISSKIKAHYNAVANALTLEKARRDLPACRNLVLVPVAGVHRATLKALSYAKSLGSEVRAVHVETQGLPNPRTARLWDKWGQGVPLVVVQSPYRELASPLLDYVEKVQEEEGFDYVTILVSEFITDSWWESLLHNHSAFWLQLALRKQPKTALVSLRFSLHELEEDFQALEEPDEPSAESAPGA